MKSSTLFVAMDLMHSQTKVDLITGLKSRTKTGRPDWEQIFRDLAKQHAPHKVDVFFCGPPGLSTQLKSLCTKYGQTVQDDNQYTICMDGYRYQNSAQNLGITHAELTKLANPKVIATNYQDVLEEYLSHHQNLNSHIEGRLVYK